MTTKSQEAFEALFKEVFPIQHHDWFEKDSLGYVSNSTNNGYKLYLATRKQVLEEALKLTEDHRLDLDGSEYHRGWRNASIRLSNMFKELMK